jgi:hypothetical protein
MDEQDKQEIEKLIKALEGWANGQPPINPKHGICGNIDSLFCVTVKNVTRYESLIFSYLPNMFENWEHYSGCPVYPIENTMAEYIANKFKWQGETGNKRRHLCNHLANQFRKLINEQ